jgi:hypothetical protein
VLDVAAGNGNASLAAARRLGRATALDYVPDCSVTRAGVASPILWGMQSRLEDLFRGTRSLRSSRKEFMFRYESAAHFFDVFRRFYGPTYVAFRMLDAEAQARLAADISELAAKYARSSASFVVPGEYLEVVIEK